MLWNISASLFESLQPGVNSDSALAARYGSLKNERPGVKAEALHEAGPVTI